MDKKLMGVFIIIAIILAIAIPLYLKSKKSAEVIPSAVPSTEETPAEKPVEPIDGTKTSTEPQHIQVQHILIGFEGSLPGKKVERTKAQAEKLATEVLEKARKADANYDALVKEFTDDQAPGIYGMSNFGVAPDGEEFPRDQMVPAFGDVGFKLKVGELGIAPFDSQKSPFGFHIIKRTK